MRIRSAGAADAAEIARVHAATWRAAYRGLVPDAYLDGIDAAKWAEAWPSRLAPGATSRAWLAGEPAVGVASAGPCRAPDAPADLGELYMLYVLPEAWGTGVGRALFAQVVADLSARGFTAAILWVLEENRRARRFYEAAGGVLDGPPKTALIGGAPLLEVRYRFQLRPC